MRAVLLMVSIACLGACGSSAAAPRIVQLGEPAAAGMSVLTGAEIAEVFGRGSLHDAIRRLRPFFMSGGGPQEPAVYVDGVQHAGGLVALATIATDQVREVRFVRPSTAKFQFGPEAGGGAVVVEMWLRKGTIRVR